METTQTNSEWHKRREVQIGDYGEELAANWFRKQGCVIYTHGENDGAHLCDFIIHRKGKFEDYCMVDVKTKPLRKFYPDTGIDLRHYERYNQFAEKHNMRAQLIFVDEKLKWIYGNYLDVLEKPFRGEKFIYPHPEFFSTGGGIMYFHIDTMDLKRPLSDEEVAKLKQIRNQQNLNNTKLNFNV